MLDSETARIAILSGAEFVVSPHFNPEIVKLCNRYRKAVMQGILTISEAIAAMEAGTDILKLFPGDLFGPAFIKDIKGPLPYARIMPTGGVSVDNVADWSKPVPWPLARQQPDEGRCESQRRCVCEEHSAGARSVSPVLCVS